MQHDGNKKKALLMQWRHSNLWSRKDLHVVGQRGVPCAVGNRKKYFRRSCEDSLTVSRFLQFPAMHD